MGEGISSEVLFFCVFLGGVYEATEDAVRGAGPEGVMFSRMAVTNSLLSKLVPKETEKRILVEQLEKRLELLQY